MRSSVAVDHAESDQVRLGTSSGRWVLLAAILGSGVAGLDATVVNVALPKLGHDLHAGFAGLQWTLNGYTLTLASLILLGGSLGDRFGRRRVFLVGVVWFALASASCALAPNIAFLVASRALQGVGGALLMPGSLAMISASFVQDDRAKAIGAWSGFGGIASAIGPFIGGYLVAGPGWRWIFLVNIPLAVVVVLVARRHVPETRDPDAVRHLDVTGAVLGAAGLGGVTYAMISAGSGWSATVAISAAIGVGALVGFVRTELRSAHPMLPPGIFAERQFTAANIVTFVVYAALGAMFFMLVVDLQVVGGFSPLLAGAALLPVTVIMLLLSARAGALAGRIGPRGPMSVGPIVAAGGVLLLLRVGPHASYAADVLPGMIVFALGLSLIVAPLTTTVLAAAPTRYAGVASGVNNAVARAAGLLAVAVLPVAAGISGSDYEHPSAFTHGFRVAMVICAGLLATGGVIAAAVIRNPPGVRRLRRPDRTHYCAIDGPPVQAASPEPAR
ncbi:MAG TPA: MFS transporter [Jatrophihabitantaceae bacterium]|nr:MFS transporter [Jatrophihabitantaceae bacterium]